MKISRSKLRGWNEIYVAFFVLINLVGTLSGKSLALIDLGNVDNGRKLDLRLMHYHTNNRKNSLVFAPSELH